jgi:hypothetical protein
MIGDRKRLVRPAVTLLVPVVGVVVFDWRLRSVLLFYWLEVGVTVVRQSVEATFAGRPNSEEGRMLRPPFGKIREKRGGIAMPGPLPPVYPRTVPTVFTGAFVALAAWGLIGTQIVALGGQVDLSAPPLEILLGTPVDSPGRRLELLFGATGIAVGGLATFVSNVQNRPYQDLSARAIVGPRQIAGPILFLLVFFAGLFFSDGNLVAVRDPVFVAVVIGRTGLDAAEEFGVTDRYLPEGLKRDVQIGEPDSIPSGDGEPQARWGVHRPSVVGVRMLTSPGRVFSNRDGLLYLMIALFAWFVVDGTAGTIIAAGILATVALIGSIIVGIETDLRYGHLEYRLYDDCVVAYDRLLETPQWRVELDEITGTETSVAFLDRLPGFTLERLRLQTRNDSETLVGLADAGAVCEAVDEARFESVTNS